jgi:hypothetical protein
VTGKNIIGAAIKAVDKQAAAACENEAKWRFKYTKHFVKMVEVSVKSPEAALKVAKGGLDYMYETFPFVRDGKETSLLKALESTKGSFATAQIEGKKPKPAKFELEVPYKNMVLKGDALIAQLEAWVRYGTIEASAGAAIAQVAQSGWLDLRESGMYFVLLGAGAAMGPLQALLSLGANVIAVDVPQSVVPNIWKRIIGTARDSCGTLTFPLPAGTKQANMSDEQLAEIAGCNLFTQTPEVKNWLLDTHKGKQLCVGGYAYIPGEQFPRVALAMDAIIKYLTEQRKASVAFLCTPSDIHLVPPTAHAAAKKAYATAPLWQKACTILSNGKWCKPNAKKLTTDDGETLHYVDALLVAQGPNYALAKRMQHWRCVVARAAGCTISSNIAPSTATRSVTQNRMFAYAYEGLPAWKPYEVPGPETSNAVMTALLLHDLFNPMHAGKPEMPLTNPLQIFAQGGFHGGTWRCAHTYESISVPAVLLYYLNTYIIRTWLVLYNLVQTIGWGLVLHKLVSHVFLGEAPDATPWEVVGWGLNTFQNAALLEVVHSLLGMVRAPWLTTLMQVASRVAVVGVCEHVPETQGSKFILIFAGAWSFTEVVRYSWYGLNLLGKPPKPHTWLRYSTFLVLYPLGVYGEISLYLEFMAKLMTIPAIFTISLGAFVKYFVFPAYTPGLPVLYMHMLAQRKKALASLSGKNKTQ